MSEKNFETFIDFGSSKIRIAIFDNDYSKIKFFSEKECLSTFNLENINLTNSKKIIEELIQISEKKIGIHINSVNLMIDTPDLFSIDLSIKKNLEGKKINNNDIKYLLQEAKQLVQNNNFDKKIIHIIIEKFVLDDKIFYTIPEGNPECNYLTLEIKFICFSNIIFNQLSEHLKENHISIENLLCSSYIKSLNYNQLFEKYDKKVFIDIGYRKSSLSIFDKNRLILFNIIPLGGNHITKDISQVLDLSEEDSESIKKSLNQTESIFSDDSKEEFISNSEIKNKLKQNISLDLLKKVIHARIDEILNLSLKNINFSSLINDKNKCILVFTGEGSKILDKNSIYLENKFNFFKEKIENYGRQYDGGEICVGMIFLPRNDYNSQEKCKTLIESELLSKNYYIYRWRQVPINTSVLGVKAESNRPEITQVIFKSNNKNLTRDDLERDLFVVRKKIEKQANILRLKDFYICSLS